MCCIPRFCNMSFGFPPMMGFGFGMPMMTPFWGGGCCSGPSNFAEGLGFGLGMGIVGSLLNRIC